MTLSHVFRDKFLNGKALLEYDDKWRNATQSLENWEARFNKYWLPALISQGSVPRTQEFNETLNKVIRAYQIYVNGYVSQSSALLANPSQEEDQFYGAKEMDIAHLMILYGPCMGLCKIIENAYNFNDLIQRFRNISFTFNQFLHHVVWTHEMGMPDEHWMTYTEMWEPCRIKFDYILKLETIKEEVEHLFSGVLGFQEVNFPVKHRSYGNDLSLSDLEYYRTVSKELMDRILYIYRHDFAIFGYIEDQ